MTKEKLDLSIAAHAEISRNRSAILGLLIMNLVLAMAYLLEVLKGTRTIFSYSIVAVLCIFPLLICWLAYLKKNDTKVIRYAGGIGFLLLYSYVMFTTSTELTFCYIFVIYVILMVYGDLKHSVLLALCALVINAAVLGTKMLTTGLSAKEITNAEIMLACLLMIAVFGSMSVRKITMINNANLKKAEEGKLLSTRLLDKTLDVAANMTEHIEQSAAVTKRLNMAVEDTWKAMNQLNEGTSDVVSAVQDQRDNTEEISQGVEEVEAAVGDMGMSLDRTKEALEEGIAVMHQLLGQVKKSESSSLLVAKEMEELKSYTEKMNLVLGLINNVAKQTGLLALNASIEAARAGDAGRGFSVVAEEISGLAAQTSEATGDIERLILSTVDSVTRVGQAVDEMVESNRLQNQYVEKTADNYRLIESNTTQISEKSEMLQMQVTAVSEANRQIVEQIEQVSGTTQELTAAAGITLESCNENVKSITELTGLMTNLSKEADKLKQEEAV